MTDWQVGMKAVCIRECDGIKVRTILTVSAVRMFEKGSQAQVAGTDEFITMSQDYLLLGFAERPIGYWFANRFRPVVERKSDISVFTAMLNTVKEPERELAR